MTLHQFAVNSIHVASIFKFSIITRSSGTKFKWRN